ncbi:hypothetical protein [Cellulomonas triticagri]|uniref:Uncharacterized protein n=1 Tax=Cellulomonas triticagri TaxID=2483352 RepID=A0A3M2IZP8_9CELL|nr:hypothetical protein [Cellulomonas triticagri]RMI05130.1 hypothetical protein EBM89_16405 [Cellulomonas triticagri]
MSDGDLGRSLASPAERVAAVHAWHAGRGLRATRRDHAFTGYVLVLLAFLYVLPVVLAAGRSGPSIHLAELQDHRWTSWAAAAVVWWVGQLLALRWGALLMRPFLLHVFTSTDLRPASFLRPLLRRRAVQAFVVVTAVMWTAVVAVSDARSGAGLLAQSLALAAALAGLAVSSWLCGQVWNPTSTLLGAVCAPAVLALPVVGPWGSGAIGFSSILLGLALGAGYWADRTVGGVDLRRLEGEVARAARATVHARTGMLVDALDQYLPEPRWGGVGLIGRDGRPRSLVVQGAVRAVRTPHRAAAGLVAVVAGSCLVMTGILVQPRGAGAVAWACGAVAAYLAAGWLSSTWWSLRDEIATAPILGPRGGGTVGRAVVWPGVALTAGAVLGAGLAVVVAWPVPVADLAGGGALTLVTVVLVLAARVMSATRTDLPVELLLPAMSPLGDLSGVRVVAWQLDGVLAVGAGTVLMTLAPSSVGSAALGLGVAVGCAVAAVRRSGAEVRALIPAWRGQGR